MTNICAPAHPLVDVGDVVTGYVYAAKAMKDTQTWHVVLNTLDQGVDITDNTVIGETGSLAIAGLLEYKDVTTCSMLPPNNGAWFWNISVHANAAPVDVNSFGVPLGWKPQFGSINPPSVNCVGSATPDGQNLLPTSRVVGMTWRSTP